MHDRNTFLEAVQRTAETKLNVSNAYVIRCMWEREKYQPTGEKNHHQRHFIRIDRGGKYRSVGVNTGYEIKSS